MADFLGLHVRPAAMFLCGLKVSFGVFAILVSHLLFNLAYIFITFDSIVLHHGGGFINSWGPVWQFGMIGFELCGLPIIVGGIWLGHGKRITLAIRFYLFYLFLSFVVNTFWLWYYFIYQDDQCKLASAMQTTKHVGAAFMCGFVRIMSYLFVTASVAVHVYIIYIIWSHCEDIYEGNNGPALWEMIPKKEANAAPGTLSAYNQESSERDCLYSNIIGITYWGDNPGAYGSPYGMYDTSIGGILASRFGGSISGSGAHGHGEHV